MATVLLENGAMGSVVNSVLSPRQRTHLRFDFQEATVEVDSLYGYSNADWRYSIPDGASHADSLARWQKIPEDALSMHAGQVADLLDCIEEDRRPSTSGAGDTTPGNAPPRRCGAAPATPHPAAALRRARCSPGRRRRRRSGRTRGGCRPPFGSSRISTQGARPSGVFASSVHSWHESTTSATRPSSSISTASAC